jgi:hypothetical protein
LEIIGLNNETYSTLGPHIVATNGVALAKPVTGHPPFDEWHINCAIHLVLIVIPIKMFGDIIFVVLAMYIISKQRDSHGSP